MKTNIGWLWAAIGIWFSICAIGGFYPGAFIAMFCGYQWGEFQGRAEADRHNT